MDYTEHDLLKAVARGMVSGNGTPIKVGARQWRKSVAAGLAAGLTGAESPQEQVERRKSKPDSRKAALLARYEAAQAEVQKEQDVASRQTQPEEESSTRSKERKAR